MTLREVDWRLKAIVERKKQSMEMQATLHGLKIKGGNSTSAAHIDDKAKSVFDKMLKGNKSWQKT